MVDASQTPPGTLCRIAARQRCGTGPAMKSFRTLGLVALLALALITGVVYLVLTYVAPMDASLRSATLLTAVLAVLLIGPFVHQVIWRRKLYVLEPLIIFSLYIFL